jgi:hypothetical protein
MDERNDEEDTMKTPYWIDFVGRQSACIEAGSVEEAERLAMAVTKSALVKVRTLPYPATPRIGEPSDCPAFCYRPRECAGRTCCPQNPSCTE